VFLWIPKQVAVAVNAGGAAGWVQGIWTILVVPLLLWMVLGSLTLLTGGARSLGEAWRRLALPLAVIVAAGHMAKGLEKFTSWAGFLPHALAEPTGIQTATKMNAKILPQPTAWLNLPALSIAAMALAMLGVFLALRETRLADSSAAQTRIVPVLALGGFYSFIIFGWGGWLS
jgi:hypothetical protein